MTQATDTTTAASLDTLRGVLDRETHLLGTLHEALVRQRTAVAENDTQLVDAASVGIDAALADLRTSREERRRVLHTLVGDEGLPLAELETRLDRPLPPSLGEARHRLESLARTVGLQLGVNRRVIRAAADTGSALMRHLARHAAPDAGAYGATGTESGSLLFNRTV